MKMVMRLIPLWLVEMIARLGGYIVGLAKPGSAYGAERKLRGAYWGLRLGSRNMVIGRHVQMEGERFKLGRNVKLFDGGQYVTANRGWIHIGDNTHISRMSIVSGLGGVEIGKGCAISAHVAIYSVTADTNAPVVADAENSKQTVRIGDNVYIGVGAKIIPGITIGNNAVIAAGAIVTRDVPDDMLAKGVPASCSPLTKRRTV